MDHIRSAADPLTFDLGPRRAWVWLTVGVALLTVAECVALAAMILGLAILLWQEKQIVFRL